MQVTTMRYARKFNVAQYESEEIIVDVVPAEGQSAESLLAETRAFVEGSRPKVNGAFIEQAALAKPMAVSAKTATKPKRASKKKAAEPTETMDALLACFDPVDLDDPDLDLDELQILCTDIAERFRAINTPDNTSDEKRQVIAKLRDCRAAIDASKK